jgi:hypothetical protein
MSVIKNHGPKILLAAVAAGCGVFAWLDSAGTGVNPKDFADLDSNVEKIKKAVNSRTVSDKYPYGHEALNGLKYQDDTAAVYERATKRFEAEIPANVAYQVPSRPTVDSGTKPSTEAELTNYQDAELRELADIKASGDHGRVFVTFKVPAKMKYMEAQRVEIFRGESEAKIDTKTPYATIEFMPEESGAAAAAKEEAAAPEDKKDDSGDASAGARRRRERAGGDEKEAPKSPREAKKAPAAAEIPAEYADVKVFADTHVVQKQQYFYKMRLIGKMTVMPDQKTTEKDANGLLSKITVVRAPKGAQTVAPARNGAQIALFSTPMSSVVSAAPPSNFEIRLAGTSGKIDPPGTPEFKRGKDYKGTFAVRVWVTEAQAWKEISIQTAPDERVKGTVRYRDSDTKEGKDVDFDANYRLVEIKWGETVREQEVEEPELDKEGNPIQDPKTRKPKMVKRIKKGDPIPNEVAVLEDLTSHKMEEFPKRADFGAREKSLEYYSRILDEQQKADKVFKVKMEKVKERIKADDDARKAKAEADAAAANASNAAAQQPAGGAAGGGGNDRPRGGGGREKR